MPRSARASVPIPLLGDETTSTTIGYGGTIVEDYQRGTLIYKLDGPSGPELVTRATAQTLPPPSAPLVYQPAFPKRRVVSLVDIPVNAPLGTHTLHIVRRRIEGGTPVDYASAGPFGLSLIMDPTPCGDGFFGNFLTGFTASAPPSWEDWGDSSESNG